jgi:hypothetical protein
MLVGFVCHSDLRPGQDVSLLVNNECQMLRSMRMVQQSLDLCKPRRRDKVRESTKTQGQQVFPEDLYFKWQQIQLFGLSLPRVGDLSPSESTGSSAKHVGSFQPGNFKNENCRGGPK